MNRRGISYFIEQELSRNVNKFHITNQVIDELEYYREESKRLKEQVNFLYREIAFRDVWLKAKE